MKAPEEARAAPIVRLHLIQSVSRSQSKKVPVDKQTPGVICLSAGGKYPVERETGGNWKIFDYICSGEEMFNIYKSLHLHFYFI